MAGLKAKVESYRVVNIEMLWRTFEELREMI